MSTGTIIGIIALIVAAGLFIFACLKMLRAIQRHWHKLWSSSDENLPPRMDHLFKQQPARKPYSLKDRGPFPLPKAGDLIRMTHPSSRPFTFAEEQHAAVSHQRLWIKYEDFNGNRTKREVDVYHPKEDDEYIFAWCRLKAEPRTFKREKILQWQFLGETFECNPLVERFFQEEGGRERRESIPWKRWLERQAGTESRPGPHVL